jgi:outer membrane lipoprotein SlyB
MKPNVALLPVLFFALLAPACATTTASTTTWGDPNAQGNWARYGRVESIRESVQHQQGDPGSGAAAGAVIGGVLGTVLGGRGFGTFFGAAEGAMIGADASRGGYVGRTFEVFVRFDDGSLQNFVYRDQLPFRPGEYVVWTAQGLARR